MALAYEVRVRANHEHPWRLYRTTHDAVSALEVAHAAEEATYETRIVPVAVLRPPRTGWWSKEGCDA